MYYYFSSGFPAVLKLNGVYFGRIDGSVKGLNVDGENIFAEVYPLDGEPSMNFLITEEFLSDPVGGAAVTDLKGGYLVKFYKTAYKSSFKILCQQKYADAAVTVFSDNGLKISVETAGGFFAGDFPFYEEEVTAERFLISGTPFIAVYFKQNKSLYVYSVSGEPKEILKLSADEFCTEGEFYTVVYKKDMAKHKIKTLYNVEDGILKKRSENLSRAENFDPAALPERLLVYAFAEEVSAGGDFSVYLGETVKKNADKIRSYLGNFISVMPSPPFKNSDRVGLIYKKKENLYSVEYLTAEIKDGKIENLKRSAN